MGFVVPCRGARKKPATSKEVAGFSVCAPMGSGSVTYREGRTMT